MSEILKLNFMDRPDEERWLDAETRLKILGALDNRGVTDDGLRMERLPVSPMIGRMLLASIAYGCTREMCTIAAALTARPVFVRPRGKEDESKLAHARFFANVSSDAATLFNVMRAWDNQQDKPRRECFAWARDNFLSSRALTEIEQNRQQMMAILEKEGVEIVSLGNAEQVLKAIAAGLIVNLAIAHSDDRSFRSNDHDNIYIHPGSSTWGSRMPMFVYTTIVETSRAFARNISLLRPEWLSELLPKAALQEKWNISYGEVSVRLYYRNLEISRRIVTDLAEMPAYIRSELEARQNRTLPEQSAFGSIWAIRRKRR